MRSKTTIDTRLLVVVDDSEASQRAVKYVGQLVGQRKRFRIYLVHVLEPLPPALLEHGGSEDPKAEARMERAMRAEQLRWLTSARKNSRQYLEKSRATLKRAGIPAKAVQTLFCEPGEGREMANSILRIARRCRCHTVVAGRKSVSWFHEVFSQDLAEELLRSGKGFCIWVIE